MDYAPFRKLRHGDRNLGGASLECHVGYIGTDSFNLQITPTQAIALAKELRRQAAILKDNGVEGGAVHLKLEKKSPQRIWCGTHGLTKSPGRNRKKPLTP